MLDMSVTLCHSELPPFGDPESPRHPPVLGAHSWEGAMSAVHHSHAWAKLAAARKAIAKQRREPCWRCGLPIDYTLSGMHKWGPQVDHVIPATLRPDLALDPQNLAVAHRWCNQRHGAALGGKAKKRRRPVVRVSSLDLGCSREW